MATAACGLDCSGTSDYGACGYVRKQKVMNGDCIGAMRADGRPASMRLPNETIQQIYLLLYPQEYNSARHTCRSWFLASLDRELLVRMLKRGGWWSSILQMMSPLSITRLFNLNQERIMRKWISRECELSDPSKCAFKEVGYTDFGGLVPGTTVGAVHGALVFTGSLCGRFLLVTHGRNVYVYELNHVCSGPRSKWSVPLRPRETRTSGILRPVALVPCPRQVIACSMDASAGRYAVAVLMQGRTGMVYDVMAERVKTSKTVSANTCNEGSDPSMSTLKALTTPVCICQDSPVTRGPPIEEGPRSIYSNIGHADDPPRSVAICAQQNCVAFGCSSGIELHWVDALTNQSLSRMFPLASPSDYLYFLPRRKGVDTGKKLRLLSSAAALGNVFGPTGTLLPGFEARFSRPGGSGVVSVMGVTTGEMLHDVYSAGEWAPQRTCVRPRDLLDQRLTNNYGLRRVSASSADQYRAVPLSDGYHILFTDPKTGNLGLGPDAPIGAVNRLLRKVWFRPPAAASSPSPVLYTAGSDTRHGVRVAAAFPVSSGDHLCVRPDEATPNRGDPQRSSKADKQIVVFYTIPPDVFHDISGRSTLRSLWRGLVVAGDDGGENLTEWVSWRPEESYREISIVDDPFHNSAVYPLEIQGQPVAMCGSLVELVLDSGPDMVLWGFGAEGWARAWSMDVGQTTPPSRAAIQRDGSIRHVDGDDNIVMGEVEPANEAEGDGMTCHASNRVESAVACAESLWERGRNPAGR